MKKKSCDHREKLGSKGDLRRPTNTKKFSDNYDKIFAKKKSADGLDYSRKILLPPQRDSRRNPIGR